MERILNNEERLRLDRRVAEAEKRTGAQFVLAVIGRSDVHAELPWKAFALGAAVAGLAVTVLDRLSPAWTSGTAVLLAVVVMLCVGGSGALLCVTVPRFARLFLDAHRAEVETRQYARSLFMTRELFATRGRTGVLLLVSLFERQVVVLPDKGLGKLLSEEVLHGIIARMTAALASGQVVRALEEGLNGLEGVLALPIPVGSRENELPDGIVEEKGP